MIVPIVLRLRGGARAEVFDQQTEEGTLVQPWKERSIEVRARVSPFRNSGTIVMQTKIFFRWMLNSECSHVEPLLRTHHDD
jgi:hypothetical protein